MCQNLTAAATQLAMRFETTTDLAADAPSPTNRIHVPNLRGDIFPSEFCRLSSDAHCLSFLLANTAFPVTGRIIKINQDGDIPTALLNVFCRPKQLPTHLRGAVTPLSHPCTMFVPELVQTTAIIEVKATDISASISVFHHDTLSDKDASIYVQGMEDMHVIRYIYNIDENR